MTDEFAAFAEVYDQWIAGVPVTAQHAPFYVDEFLRAGGPCVEIGVGNGRITIEAARRGVAITGVDVSPAMLALCRERAAAAGVADRVALLDGDMRSFRLPAAASCIAIPFHTIGHAITLDDKLATFRNVHAQLAPGGRFVFDAMVFDPKYAAANANVPRIRTEFRDPVTGEDAVLLHTSLYDMPQQRIRIIAWTDRLDAAGVVTSRRYVRMNFSWITPEQSKSLLESAGFEIEHCFGGFDRSAFAPTSSTQIWVARRR